jgi:aldose 1-epimerase
VYTYLPRDAYQVTYSLTLDNRLEMLFRAESDAATPVAMTNHTYWNLSGGLRAKVTDHTLRVNAETYLALGEHMVRGIAMNSFTVCSSET